MERELKDEQDYYVTLKHMVYCNKESFDNIITVVKEINNKINIIDHSKKDLVVNIEAHKSKQENLKIMLRNLKKDNTKVDELVEVQDNIIYNLIGNVDRSQQNTEKTKNDFEAKIINHNLEIKKLQENIIAETKKTEKLKKNIILEII